MPFMSIYRGTLSAVVVLVVSLGLSSVAEARKPAPSQSDVLRQKARKIFLEGQIHYKLGRFDKALVAYSQAYRLLPLAGFLFNIGQCHRFLRNYKQAIFFYKGYLRETPGAPNLKVVQLLIVRTQNKLTEETTRRARAKAQYDEGVRLYALGQVRPALAKFQAAYRALPSPGYRYHIAQCHRKLKEWKSAIFYYQGYLKDNPATPMAGLVEGHLKTCRQRLKAGELRRRGILNPDLGKGGGKGKDGPKVVPVYKKWWLWTLVAVGVAALATGLGVGLTLGTNQGLEAPPTTLGTVSWR